MKFVDLVARQLESIQAEVGRIETWDESFSRIDDAFDAFVYYATVGKADFSFAVSLANLYAEVQRSYIDHSIQDNSSFAKQVEVDQKRLAGRTVSTIGEAKGKLTFSVERLRQHLSGRQLGISVRPLLIEVAALATIIAHDLHVSLNENEGVKGEEEAKPKTRGKKA